MRIITDLPDNIDPIALIKEKIFTCPMCGERGEALSSIDKTLRDNHGKVHDGFLDWTFNLQKKDKYWWARYSEVRCKSCGCRWDTGWYPVDHEMFEVDLTGEKEQIKQELTRKIKEW